MPSSSQDTLQRSASFSSLKSDKKNEVLTVTTDYGIPSPDAGSVSPNAINESGILCYNVLFILQSFHFVAIRYNHLTLVHFIKTIKTYVYPCKIRMGIRMQ